MTSSAKNYVKVALTFVGMALLSAVTLANPFGERTEKIKEGKK